MAKALFAISRANPRFSLLADAEVMELPEGTPIAAQLSELSSRGCYLDAVSLIPIGTELRVRIHYGNNTCELPGKVIYAHSGNGMGVCGMGVLFGNMVPEQCSAVKLWLEELAAQSASPAA